MITGPVSAASFAAARKPAGLVRAGWSPCSHTCLHARGHGTHTRASPASFRERDAGVLSQAVRILRVPASVPAGGGFNNTQLSLGRISRERRPGIGKF